jgi:hypothetical protein
LIIEILYPPYDLGRDDSPQGINPFAVTPTSIDQPLRPLYLGHIDTILECFLKRSHLLIQSRREISLQNGESESTDTKESLGPIQIIDLPSSRYRGKS